METLKYLKHNFRYCVNERYRELVKDWKNTSLMYREIFNYSGRTGKIKRLNKAVEKERARRNLECSLPDLDEEVLNRICHRSASQYP